MSDGELNRQVEEEVMLRVPCDRWQLVRCATVVSGAVWAKVGTCEHKRCYPRDNPSDYFGSIGAAFEMEEEIERRGLQYYYVRELLSIECDIYGFLPQSDGDCWDIIHATPEQRCEAALEAVRLRRKDNDT